MNSKKLVEDYLYKQDWRVKENSNSPYCFGALNKHLSASVSADYWLKEVYTTEIGEAHKHCFIKLHDLGILSLYSYFGEECVLIKYNNNYSYISFRQLYALIKEEEEIFNEKDGAYVKYPKDLFVEDKNGFVNISRVIKKKRNNNFYFVKSTNGFSQLVTDNHPVITNKGDVIAKDLTNTHQISTYKQELYGDQKEICVAEIIKEKFAIDNYTINGKTIKDYKEQGLLSIYNSPYSINNYLKLDGQLGWLIGMILAEGSIRKNNISIAQNDGVIKNKISECLNKISIAYNVSNKDVSIKSKVFIKFINSLLGNEYSKLKHLPSNFINFNKEFLLGIIAGVFDGDGTRTFDYGLRCIIRITSRLLLNQLSYILRSIDINPREGKPYFNNKSKTGFKSNFPMFYLSFSCTKDLLPESIKCNSEGNKTVDSTKKTSKYDFGFGEKNIVVLKEIDYLDEEFVYDITTETNTFLCNGILSHNCSGYSLRTVLEKGIKGIANIPASKPAKHFMSILNQLANLTTIFQNEIAGAVAFNNVDTLLAPFVKEDKLTYDEVYQFMQNFIFSINSNSRAGAEPSFSNLTFDLTPDENLLIQPVTHNGKLLDYTYKECQKEMDMINKAFFTLMLNGDAQGKPFGYPIPTYNIHNRFDWDNPNNDLLWELCGKYGTPYFANFINSDMDPKDIRSLCCRLRLDLKELRHKNGGLFGSGDSTGSIGVCTLNLPRLAHVSNKDIPTFYNILDKYLNIAKDSLEIRRGFLQKLFELGTMPAFKEYVGTLNNYFNTIGYVGLNECLVNLTGKNILENKQLGLEILGYIRKKIIEFQQETGHLYNLEATPAESTAFSFAKKDVEEFGYKNICVQGPATAPYYTNSCHIPVKLVNNIKELLDNQNELQAAHTGGTVVHIYTNGPISGQQAKNLIQYICKNYKIPYVSHSPLNTICPEHGLLIPSKNICDICGQKTQKYQRITGYIRNVEHFNPGKTSEFNDRNQICDIKV